MQSDPMGFAGDLPDRAILDEIHPVPQLFRAIKLSVDRHRVPGRFTLTGSTNVLLVPDLADALTGRLETVRLHPSKSSHPSTLPKERETVASPSYAHDA